MSIYLDTRGRAFIGIAICDRCKRKFPIDELMSDPNSPGLRVCRDDVDQLDPYRLPARQTENITLPFVRPDAPLVSDPLGIVSEDDNYALLGNGNTTLEPPPQ
jgi:hypothetical protein